MKPGIYHALEMAVRASCHDEVPVGAVIVDEITGEVVATAHNEMVQQGHPLAHAEMLAIERACATRKSRYLKGCALYVTLEPCPMCAQAISFAQLDKVYFGASDPKSGGVLHGPRIYEATSAHHKPKYVFGLQESVCAQLMHDFFLDKRG